jgi:hypothetical protein
MANGSPRHYVFYAEASSFAALVDGAAPQIIPDQAFQQLSPYGGRQASPHTPLNQQGFKIGDGYTTVSGNPNNGGWTTCATSVVEKLDICGVVTADRITAQITTEYPSVGYVPSISFNGTEFVNLKVNGNAVTPNLNLGMCSPKPANDAPYIDDAGLLGRAQAEFNNIANSNAPPNIRSQFQWNAGVVHRRGRVDCSLVTGVAGLPAYESFGHVLVVPNFGIVYLAELGVGNHIDLTMVRIEHTALGNTESRTVHCESQGHGMP